MSKITHHVSYNGDQCRFEIRCDSIWHEFHFESISVHVESCICADIDITSCCPSFPLSFLSSLSCSFLCSSLSFYLLYKCVLYCEVVTFWRYEVVNKHHTDGSGKATPSVCRYSM